MPYEEKTAWVYGSTAIVGYLVYLVLVLTAAAAVPLPEVDYVPALLWTIGSTIVVNIVASIVIRSATKPGRDERDRQIYRFGEYVGNSFVVIGGIVALVLAMLTVPHFWIANALYLGFMLSAVVGTMAKLSAYRTGLPRW